MSLSITPVYQNNIDHNVRDIVTKSSWDFLRKKTYREASYRYQICDGVGKNHPVECHEIWEFGDFQKIQSLNGLIALCPSCHEVKHIGLSRLKGNLFHCLQYLSKVNNITLRQAYDYAIYSSGLCKERNNHQWHIELSYLIQFDIEYTPKFINYYKT
ncbi:HNH endonuclease [Francisellaceae bacterium]|nr:HNH endonuclease [Francisellaceae bacterium]